MILDSLYILSEKHGFYSFAKFSELVTNTYISDYLSKYVFGRGKNPDDWFAPRLIEILTREGVSSDHMAVQWTELYLETRGLGYIDFDFYLDKFKLLSGDRVSDEAIVKSGTQEHHMALTVAYTMSGGRSWMIGEKISFEKYKQDKEGYDLGFRTKETRRKNDLDRFSKIDIDEYIDKLGSIGKKKS